MTKFNIRRIALSILVGILGIGLFLPMIIQSYTLKQIEKLQFVSLREFSEEEKQKLYLFESLDGDYAKFRLLARVITCESLWQAAAYNPKSKDWGLFQINQALWDKKADELGLNYKDAWQDNIQMGLHIYHTQGIKAWDWSKNCWQK